MPKPIIEVENISKLYRLGLIGSTTLRDSVERWWYRIRGKEELSRKIGTGRLMIEPDDPQAGPEPNTLWALKNISFSVQRGEIVGIIGKNGAGKTTLLKVLTRITEPTSGRAVIRGRVSSMLEVGTGFHPELTGRENVYLNGAILGMRKSEIAHKFDEIVDFSGVEKFIDTPVKRYSSGMYVRLAFAVAAHLEPEVLLIDEVLAVGDAEFQKKCLSKMSDIGMEGRTVLYVSHNMPSIVNLCQRAILLSEGKIASDGKSADVVQQYLSTMRSAGGEVVWSDPSQAPGNDIVRLHAVRILQKGIEGPTADVDISKEILIEIEYWNLQEGALLYPVIWMRDQMGTFVLASSNHKSISLTDDSWCGRPRPIGLFQSVCRIPGNFLNEGLYSITAAVGKGTSDTQVLEDYVVSFHVHDTGEMRKDFFRGWLGIVRPRLAWSTKRMQSTVGLAEYSK